MNRFYGIKKADVIVTQRKQRSSASKKSYDVPLFLVLFCLCVVAVLAIKANETVLELIDEIISGRLW